MQTPRRRSCGPGACQFRRGFRCGRFRAECQSLAAGAASIGVRHFNAAFMDIGKRTRKESSSSSSSSSISEWTRNYRWPMNAIKKNRVSISPQVCEDGSSSKVEDEDDDEDEKEWEPCQARAFLAIPRRAVMNHHTPYHSARSPFGSTELTCAQRKRAHVSSVGQTSGYALFSGTGIP